MFTGTFIKIIIEYGTSRFGQGIRGSTDPKGFTSICSQIRAKPEKIMVYLMLVLKA